MSSTAATTTTSVSGPVSTEAARLRNWRHLLDYELHHSNTTPESRSTSRANGTINGSQSLNSEASTLRRGLQNPLDWPNNHRRIPPHRPVNTELDQSQRRVYTSTGERMFLTVMFTGVQTSVNFNRAWNATLGRINGNWFKYKVGGEW